MADFKAGIGPGKKTGGKGLQPTLTAIKVFAALILLVVPTAAQETAQGPTFSPALAAELPYRIDYDGWFTVEATVDGQGPYDFIIDTGATLTLVFRRLFDRHQFSADAQPPRRILGLGAVNTLQPYRIGDIDMGGARLDDHVGVVLENWAPPRRTPDGVIGLDLLRRYFVVFDRPTKTLKLYHHTVDRPDIVAGWSSTALVADDFGLASGELYTLTGRIQRRPIRFILDLGASGTMINAAALSSLMSGVTITRWSDPLGRSSTRISGAFDQEGKAVILAVRRFFIGRAKWKNRRFAIYNPPIFEELGVSKKAFGLLGADLFTDRSFAIDFRARRLYIGPAGKEASGRRTQLDAIEGQDL